MKTMKYYDELELKCDALLLVVFEKLKNSSLKTMDYVQVIIWAHQL